MTHWIYIVEREGGDGLETDCFTDLHLANEWAEFTGGRVREEPILNKAEVEIMKGEYDL